MTNSFVAFVLVCAHGQPRSVSLLAAAFLPVASRWNFIQASAPPPPRIADTSGTSSSEAKAHHFGATARAEAADECHRSSDPRSGLSLGVVRRHASSVVGASRSDVPAADGDRMYICAGVSEPEREACHAAKGARWATCIAKEGRPKNRAQTYITLPYPQHTQ
mmetsp:Transcript_7389/g.22839  ORF Transcript_7389/g.22839 Transcript_7389/m.22839 type:complete len:163 (-) Transcript_7389:567-1055(-)|eukprot:scaffold152999_cov27-Tisochrysis_lutea.AAC.3